LACGLVPSHRHFEGYVFRVLPRIDRHPFPGPCSYVVIHLSGFPSRRHDLSSFTGQPLRSYPLGSIVRRAPGLLRDWLPSQVWTDLEALFPIRSVPLSPAVSPADGRTTLLTFPPSGFPHLPPWGYPQPSRGCYLNRASGRQEPRLPLRGAYPPGVLTF